MKIIVNIEKRHAFMIFAGIILLAAAITVYAAVTPYANPETNVGHSASEIGPGTIDGSLNVNGLLTAKGNLNVDGTGGKFLYLNAGADIIKQGSEGEVRYCKDTGVDCQVTPDTPVKGSVMGGAYIYSTGDGTRCGSWGVGNCAGTSYLGGCNSPYTKHEFVVGWGKFMLCIL